MEDILHKIRKCYYPIDFLVLYTQFVVNMESKIPLITRRPFIATINAWINCRNDLMRLSFKNMTLEVKSFHFGKQPCDEDECFHTYMIDSLILEEVHLQNNYECLEYLFLESDSKPCILLLIHLLFLMFQIIDRKSQYIF